MSQGAELPALPGLYIGGLRNDLHPAKLAALLCDLLAKFRVNVANHFVHIQFRSHEAFSIIELPDLSVSQRLLSHLSTTDNVSNLFDLRSITFDPANFRVGPKLTNNRRYRSRSRPNERKNGSERSNASQRFSSTPPDCNGGGYRSRSRAERRLNGQRGAAESDLGHGSGLVDGETSGNQDELSKRTSRRRFRKNKPSYDNFDTSVSLNSHRTMELNQSGTSRSIGLNQSGTSRSIGLSQSGTSPTNKSVETNNSRAKAESASTSESEGESPPASFDPSACSKGSDVRSDQSETSVAVQPMGARLQAGGVRRLVQEFSGVDPVSRSMSDRSLRDRPSGSKTSTTTTSTTGLPFPSHVSVTTSTPGAGAGLVANFYRQGQTIGRETRHSEFKQGGKVKDRSWLMEIVGKYVCGFLNSCEGGTLYFGVNDSGVAVGIDCPQSKEDDYRLLIDEALKSIDPPLFTDVYSVRFIPLMELNGQISDSLQVLEVEVKVTKPSHQLYVFRGNAFLRRDGSLQGPLKARQVQEWTRKRLECDGSSNLLKSQVSEMTTQLEEEQQKTSRMQQQLRELEDHMLELTEELAHYRTSPPSTAEE